MALSPMNKQTAGCKSPHNLLTGEVHHGFSLFMYVELKMVPIYAIWPFLVLAELLPAN